MNKTIEVVSVKEQEDGGATITFELGDETIEMLCQYAIKDILTKAAEEDLAKPNSDSEKANCQFCLYNEGEQPCCSCDTCVHYDTIPNREVFRNVLEDLYEPRT